MAVTGSVKVGLLLTAEVEPRVKMSMPVTVLPICLYFAVIVPLPRVILVVVGVHVCHAQLEPVPLCKFSGWIFPAGKSPSFMSNPSIFTPLAEVNSLTVSTVNVGLVIVGELIVGLVKVLFVKVWVEVNWTTELGKVGVPSIVYVPAIVPERVGELMAGEVSVFAVSVCVSEVDTGLPPEKPSRVLGVTLFEVEPEVSAM